jgi:hypothetical protein
MPASLAAAACSSHDEQHRDEQARLAHAPKLNLSRASVKVVRQRWSAQSAAERAAGAKAKSERAQIQQEAGMKSQVDAGMSGPQIPPF